MFSCELTIDSFLLYSIVKPLLLTIDVNGFFFPSQIVVCTRVNTNLQVMDPATLQSKFELL